MDLIILLLIIFLVWRHFKKKKARKQEAAKVSAANTAPASSSRSVSGTVSGSVSRPENSSASHGGNPHVSAPASGGSDIRLKFNGFPIYTPRPFAMNPGRGGAVPESALPSNDDKLLKGRHETTRPDYAFACAKKFYEKYLAKAQAGKLNISAGTAPTIRLWFDTARLLARYYQMGLGCEPDPQAALDLMLPVEQYGTQQSNREDSLPNTDEVIAVFAGIAENLLSLAECYACMGRERESEKYYRMAMAASRAAKYPDILEQKILKSAMGGFPIPANPTIAGELALKLIQKNRVFAAYAMMEIKDLQAMDYKKIGVSYEQDFQVYLEAGRKTGSVYAAYKLGGCYLYGKGVSQNVELGLSLLHDASFGGNLNATEEVHDYLEAFDEAEYKKATGKKLSFDESSAANDTEYTWYERLEHMEENTQILAAIQKVIDGHDGAEELIGKRIRPEAFPTLSEDLDADTDTEEENGAGAAFGQGSQAAKEPENEFDLSRIPFIVYDDSNRRWMRRGIYGDHAVYYNDDGEEVSIYSAQVSSSSADTSAGTLHWY